MRINSALRQSICLKVSLMATSIYGNKEASASRNVADSCRAISRAAHGINDGKACSQDEYHFIIGDGETDIARETAYTRIRRGIGAGVRLKTKRR